MNLKHTHKLFSKKKISIAIIVMYASYWLYLFVTVEIYPTTYFALIYLKSVRAHLELTHVYSSLHLWTLGGDIRRVVV